MQTPSEKFEEYFTPEYAVPEDAEKILGLIYTTSNFDPMADHLPTKKELDAMIAGKSVLKVEAPDGLAGILIFQDTGIKSYAAVLCIAENWKNNVIGYTVFAHYLNTHIDNTKHFYLWVDATNKPSIALHQYFGYRHDGVKNFIFRM